MRSAALTRPFPRPFFLALAILASTLLTGCGGGGSRNNGFIAPVNSAASVSAASGNNQTGTAGTALAGPLVVTVLNSSGGPVSGVTVTFAVTAGGGSLSPTSAVTNASGQAQTTLTLGPTAGMNTVTATVGSLQVTFTATGTVAPPPPPPPPPGGVSTAAIDGTGQLVAGSMSFTGNIGNAPNASGMTVADSVALDAVNHRLFVADQGNNRVLVFSLSLANDFAGAGGSRVPTFVLGQSSFTTATPATTQSGMSFPAGLALDPGANRLFVADSGNNRVLVFATAAITNGMNATNVLGQAGFTTAGSATTATGMFLPQGVAFDAGGSRLFVADSNNNRVLVFGTAAITNGMAASNVLGQATFTTGLAATTATGMSSPRGLAFDAPGSRLFVGDQSNNRVLVFGTAAITNGMAASNVLGQATFTTAGFATSATGMNGPAGVGNDSTNNRLYVADQNNNRVLIYSTVAITNGMAASNVLGQPDFVSSGFAASATAQRVPTGVALDPANNRAFVADSRNHRVLLYNTAVITNGMAATDGLGHTNGAGAMDFTRGNPNDPPSPSSLYAPDGAALDTVNHRLFLADRTNNRVLVYNLSFNNDFTGVGRAAAFVLGQPDFVSAAGATTATGMRGPQGLAYDSAGNRLFVCDPGSNRVLVFGTAAITNGMAASNVLGQPDFVTRPGGLSATQLNAPRGLAFDSANNRLFVADGSNNRVVVFATAAITNGMAASNVLGQPNFVTSVNSAAANGMNLPLGVAYDTGGNRLFVADGANNRVLVFNGAAVITNGMPASNVLGQPGFGLLAAATTQAGMSFPIELAFDGSRNRIFVADNGNNRVLIFGTAVVSNGMNATSVYGQASFTSAAPATGTTGMSSPIGIAYASLQNTFFVADQGNNRVLLFNAP